MTVFPFERKHAANSIPFKTRPYVPTYVQMYYVAPDETFQDFRKHRRVEVLKLWSLSA